MDLYLGTKDRQRGLARAIYEQVREAIAEGRVKAGEQLPPSRELARQLGVSRFTVTTAYGFLVAEGFLAGASGAGTVVALPASPASPRRGPAPRRPGLAPLPAPLPAAARPRLDLSLGCPDPDLFPSTEWRGQVRRALRDAHTAQYGDPAGDPKLRAAIATWIHRSRGVRASPHRVVVSAGAQQAFDLVLGALIKPGDVVAVEDPGYLPFRTLAQARGARVIPVPVDGEGLVVASLPARARLVYVTPSHQFPLGPVLSLARRRHLLEWARAAGAHVIEDDYDTEFRFSDRPLEPLARLDTDGRVIYVGSFSKTLSPSLRLGFLVVPDELVASLAGLRQVIDWCSPVFLQRALAGFLADGTMDRHLRRARRVYRARHQLVVDWLAGRPPGPWRRGPPRRRRVAGHGRGEAGRARRSPRPRRRRPDPVLDGVGPPRPGAQLRRRVTRRAGRGAADPPRAQPAPLSTSVARCGSETPSTRMTSPSALSVRSRRICWYASEAYQARAVSRSRNSMTMRSPRQAPSITSALPPWTRNLPPNGARVASMRSRYSTIAGPIFTVRRCATPYADMLFSSP
jgi:GntR family transcriptional regulator / MocR family aminotransferase